MRANYTRRMAGAAVAFAPAAVLAASFVWAVAHGSAHRPYGLAVTLLALAVGVFNVSLSFVRPMLFARARGSLDGYRHVSGIPIFGTLVVVAGGLLGFGSALCAALGLAAVALDTGGSAWFVVATWRDTSLWDA